MRLRDIAVNPSSRWLARIFGARPARWADSLRRSGSDGSRSASLLEHASKSAISSASTPSASESPGQSWNPLATSLSKCRRPAFDSQPGRSMGSSGTFPDEACRDAAGRCCSAAFCLRRSSIPWRHEPVTGSFPLRPILTPKVEEVNARLRAPFPGKRPQGSGTPYLAVPLARARIAWLVMREWHAVQRGTRLAGSRSSPPSLIGTRWWTSRAAATLPLRWHSTHSGRPLRTLLLSRSHVLE